MKQKTDKSDRFNMSEDVTTELAAEQSISDNDGMKVTKMQWMKNDYINQEETTKVEFDRSISKLSQAYVGFQFADAVKQMNQETELLVDEDDRQAEPNS